MEGHVEERGADPAHPLRDGRRVGRRVDQEEIVVGQREGDVPAPVLTGLVAPAPRLRVVLDDQRLARGRSWQVGAAGRARRRRTAPLDDRFPGHVGGPVAGLEDDQGDVRSVGTDGERARILREDLELGDLLPRLGVEDVDAIFHGGGADEGEATGEGHVVGLVADRERVEQTPRGRVDHADAVRQVVHHPDLVAPGPDREAHRLEAHRHAAGEAQPPVAAHAEDREPGLRRVDGEEAPLVGGERNGMHVARLVVGEVARRRGPGGRQHQPPEPRPRVPETEHSGHPLKPSPRYRAARPGVKPSHLVGPG